MKKFLLISLFVFAFSVNAAETKRICHDVKNAKTQKTTQQCKDVKQHKKLEGTKVPEKKSK